MTSLTHEESTTMSFVMSQETLQNKLLHAGYYCLIVAGNRSAHTHLIDNVLKRHHAHCHWMSASHTNGQ